MTVAKIWRFGQSFCYAFYSLNLFSSVVWLIDFQGDHFGDVPSPSYFIPLEFLELVPIAWFVAPPLIGWTTWRYLPERGPTVGGLVCHFLGMGLTLIIGSVIQVASAKYMLLNGVHPPNWKNIVGSALVIGTCVVLLIKSYRRRQGSKVPKETDH